MIMFNEKKSMPMRNVFINHLTDYYTEQQIKLSVCVKKPFFLKIKQTEE